MQVIVEAARDQLGSFAPLTTTGSTLRAAAGCARAPVGRATTIASARAGRTIGQRWGIGMCAPRKVPVATLAPGAKGESMLTMPIPGFRPTNSRLSVRRYGPFRFATRVEAVVASRLRVVPKEVTHVQAPPSRPLHPRRRRIRRHLGAGGELPDDAAQRPGLRARQL